MCSSTIFPALIVIIFCYQYERRIDFSDVRIVRHSSDGVLAAAVRQHDAEDAGMPGVFGSGQDAEGSQLWA